MYSKWWLKYHYIIMILDLLLDSTNIIVRIDCVTNIVCLNISTGLKKFRCYFSLKHIERICAVIYRQHYPPLTIFFKPGLFVHETKYW